LLVNYKKPTNEIEEPGESLKLQKTKRGLLAYANRVTSQPFGTFFKPQISPSSRDVDASQRGMLGRTWQAGGTFGTLSPGHGFVKDSLLFPLS